MNGINMFMVAIFWTGMIIGLFLFSFIVHKTSESLKVLLSKKIILMALIATAIVVVCLGGIQQHHLAICIKPIAEYTAGKIIVHCSLTISVLLSVLGAAVSAVYWIFTLIVWANPIELQQ